MRSKLGDLDDHLFAALERLGAAGSDADKIGTEVERSKAIVGLADQVVANARLKLEAAKLFGQYGGAVKDMLPQIGKSPTEEPGQ